mmetsp:Transcript_34026/g.87386  ORF Transcript_34026/g.87386 Transcript_34026/m.87386 type:complete len:702 (-) Transcript_34026:264-2369(-)
MEMDREDQAALRIQGAFMQSVTSGARRKRTRRGSKSLRNPVALWRRLRLLHTTASAFRAAGQSRSESRTSQRSRPDTPSVWLLPIVDDFVHVFDDRRGLVHRQFLRCDDSVKTAIDRWWEVAALNERGEMSTAISKKVYASMHHCLYKAITGKYDKGEAQASADDEWQVDAGDDAKSMTYDRFFESVFQLADVWCKDGTADGFASFLDYFLVSITSFDANKKRVWANVDDISANVIQSYHSVLDKGMRPAVDFNSAAVPGKSGGQGWTRPGMPTGSGGVGKVSSAPHALKSSSPIPSAREGGRYAGGGASPLQSSTSPRPHRGLNASRASDMGSVDFELDANAEDEYGRQQSEAEEIRRKAQSRLLDSVMGRSSRKGSTTSSQGDRPYPDDGPLIVTGKESGEYIHSAGASRRGSDQLGQRQLPRDGHTHVQAGKGEDGASEKSGRGGGETRASGRSAGDGDDDEMDEDTYYDIYADMSTWSSPVRARINIERARVRERNEDLHGAKEPAPLSPYLGPVIRVKNTGHVEVEEVLKEEEAGDLVKQTLAIRGGGDQRGLPTHMQASLWSDEYVQAGRESGTINSPRCTAGFVAEVVGKKKVVPYPRSPLQRAGEAVVSPRAPRPTLFSTSSTSAAGTGAAPFSANGMVDLDKDVWVGVSGRRPTDMVHQDPGQQWMHGHTALPQTKAVPTSLRRYRRQKKVH